MTKFTNPQALQILADEQAANDAFFAEMNAKIQDARDNTPDEQIWTTPNQRRLIATAPELLEALKLAEKHLEAIASVYGARLDGTNLETTETRRIIAAAILKAEGE